jgi:hypothetical protein
MPLPISPMPTTPIFCMPDAPMPSPFNSAKDGQIAWSLAATWYSRNATSGV